MEFTEEQQEHINKLVGDARVKARTQAKADADTQIAKDKDVADQAALAAKNEWQKLAAKHEARVKELEPLEAQATAYGVLIEKMLKDSIKNLGDAAKKAVEGLPESMSAVEKLNWLHKNEGLFQVAGGGVGTPGRPKQKTQKKSAADVGHTRLRM